MLADAISTPLMGRPSTVLPIVCATGWCKVRVVARTIGAKTKTRNEREDLFGDEVGVVGREEVEELVELVERAVRVEEALRGHLSAGSRLKRNKSRINK